MKLRKLEVSPVVGFFLAVVLGLLAFAFFSPHKAAAAGDPPWKIKYELSQYMDHSPYTDEFDINDIVDGDFTRSSGCSGNGCKQKLIDSINAAGRFKSLYIQVIANSSGSWQSLINQSSVTVSDEYYTSKVNSGYSPGSDAVIIAKDYYYSNKESLVIRQFGKIKVVIKLDCGNFLGSVAPIVDEGNPPTGSLSASCTVNAAGSPTYTIKATYNDDDGSSSDATNSYLAWDNSTGTSRKGDTASYKGHTYTWTISSWNTGHDLYQFVQDTGPGADTWVHKGTASQPNCNPGGSLSVSCTTDVNGDPTYTFNATYFDDNGSSGDATNAYIGWDDGSGSKSGTSSATYKGKSFSWSNGSWRSGHNMWLYVQDTGPGTDVYEHHGTASQPDCQPYGKIISCSLDTVTGIYTVKAKYADADGSGPNGTPGKAPARAYMVSGQYTSAADSDSTLRLKNDSGTAAYTSEGTYAYDRQDTAPYQNGTVTWQSTKWPDAANSSDGNNHNVWLRVYDVNPVGADGYQRGNNPGPDNVSKASCGGVTSNGVQCGINTLASSYPLGTSIKFKLAVNTSGGSVPLPTPGMTVSIKNAGGTPQVFAPVSPVTVTNSSGTLTTNQITFSPAAAGSYTVTWSWQGAGFTDPSTNDTINTPCTFTTLVGYQPYFNVLGGDIAAGPSFGTDSCAPGASSGIYGINTDTAGAYYGAGAQLGALALGDVQSFPSSQNADGGNAGAGEPNSLTFAHSGISGKIYGGQYGKGGWCVPDYVDNAANEGDSAPNSPPAGDETTVAVTDGALTNGTYQWGASDSRQDLTIHGGQLPAGKRLTFVVYGDVYIDSNITYANYTSTDDIPQLQLLVSGSIYVYSAKGGGVQELHGFYAAQPYDDGSGTPAGGILHTCATAPGTASNDPDICDSKLTIYGGVAANDIDLGRTHGNLTTIPGKVTNEPAETFMFTPELWLGNLTGPGTSCANSSDQSGCTYQAFTSLPPVL